MNAIQAVRNRDFAALEAALGDLTEAETFRNEVLPGLTPADCRWFWSEVMEPEQLERTLDAVRDVCLAVAAKLKMEPGKGYSLGTVDELPTMVLHKDCCKQFYAALPQARHSVLRFYLQCL